MKKRFSILWFCLGFVSFLCVVSLSFAQDAKNISWEEFWKDIRFMQSADGEWDFTHSKRPLVEYTVVTIPPQTLSVRSIFQIESDHEATLSIVVLDPTYRARVYNEDATQLLGEKEASVRFVYICKKNVPSGSSLIDYCSDALYSLLKRDLTVQSTGSGNAGYEHTGVLPEKLIFGFLVKSEEKDKK